MSGCTKGGSEPLTSSPRSDFTTLSIPSSNEVCGEHEIAPRQIQDLREKFSGRCWPRSPREIVFSRNSGKFRKQILPNWIHRRPFRQSLAEIFGNFKLLAFHCHRRYDRWQWKADSLAKEFANVFGGLFAKIFRVTSLWGKNDYFFFFLVLFLVMWSNGSMCLFFIKP